MDTALPLKFCFILDRNLAKANCPGNHVCTSCDKVVLGTSLYSSNPQRPQGSKMACRHLPHSSPGGAETAKPGSTSSKNVVICNSLFKPQYIS